MDGFRTKYDIVRARELFYSSLEIRRKFGCASADRVTISPCGTMDSWIFRVSRSPSIGSEIFARGDRDGVTFANNSLSDM